MDSGGAEAVALAETAGLVLDPWQRRVLDFGLGEDLGGRCAAQRVGLICPRQNGKNATIEAAELYWLFLDTNVELITHTAHQFDTAVEHFLRLRELITSTPDLNSRVKRWNMSHGQEGVELRDGSRLLLKARGAKGGGSGFSGDRIVFDEAWYLNDLGSLVPTLSARPDPQIWFASSAPRPGVGSDKLREWIAQGRESTGEVYVEFSAPEGTNVDDRKACAAANPAYGHRLSERYIWETERGSMTEEEFLRERFGVFPDPNVLPAWGMITEQVWAGSVVADVSPRGGEPWLSDPACLGVYVAGDQSWSAIGAAGDCRDGGQAVELVEFRPRTEWLVDRIVEICERQRISWVVVNKSTAAGVFVSALEARGVSVLNCSGSDELLADGAMFAGLCSGQVLHPADEVLTDAAKVAAPRRVGDRWAWDTRSQVAMLPLAAVSLALWGAGQPPPVGVAEWDVIFA